MSADAFASAVCLSLSLTRCAATHYNYFSVPRDNNKLIDISQEHASHVQR